jgi:hypothetical protein
LALPPLVLRAQPEGFEELRTRVATMTQTERDRFDRNSGDYLKLTEEQREHYRAMHAQIETDRQQNQGRLGQTLDDYYAWLSTLQSFPRQELRTTSDPGQRVQLVEQVLEDQSQSELRQLPWNKPPPWVRVPDLSSEQLRQLMEVIEGSVALTQEQKQRLDGKSSAIERYLELFKILRERSAKFDELLDRVGEERLMAALPQDERPVWTNDDQAAQRRRSFFTQLLFWNLSTEFQLEIKRRKPSEVQLEEFVRNWPADSQSQAKLDELLELEPDDFRQQLERAYAAQHLALDWDAVPRVMWGQNLRRERGPGSRPEFDGDRQRGPDDDDRGRDREGFRPRDGERDRDGPRPDRSAPPDDAPGEPRA